MATECSNHYYHELHSGNIDYDTDTITCTLMATTFTFNRDTHATWSDVSASELANGNGYTTGGITMPGTVAISEDDTNDRSDVTWTSDPSWTASGGSIGPTPGMMSYDNTTTDDTIIGYIDFGADQTATDGGTLTVTGVTFRLAKPA